MFSNAESWFGEHLYTIVFLGAFVDALGIPFPGRILLMTVGSASGATGADGLAAVVIALAVIGTVVGDHLWYLVGRSKGHRLLALYIRLAHLPAGRTEAADRLLRRFGGLALVLGRLAAALRIVVTPLAVSRGMSYTRFLLWDLLGAVLWAAGLVGLGRAAAALGAEEGQIWGTLVILGVLGIVCGLMTFMARRWLLRRASASRA